MLCPAHVEILVQLSAAPLFLPKISNGEKDGNPSALLLFGKHYTGQSLSQSLFLGLRSWQKAGEHERAAKEKTSKAAQWNESGNGYSKPFKFGPTALIESRAFFLWYLGTGPQEFQTFAMYHLLSPTDSCKASLLLFPEKIGLHIVWLVVFLLFFCFFSHLFVLQPQPSSS